LFDFCEANVDSLIVDYWGKYRLGIVFQKVCVLFLSMMFLLAPAGKVQRKI